MESQSEQSKKRSSLGLSVFVIFKELLKRLPSFSLPKGIGRMILKEEMRARSGCRDNEQWGSRRSSRCSSKEALNNVGFSSVSGRESGFDSGTSRSAVMVGY